VNKYIIVVHTWFVSTKGFHVYEIEAENKEKATEQGVLMKYKHEHAHCHANFRVISIEKTLQVEELHATLTWKERFFGKLNKNRSK